jgi:hypothetical protein
MELPGLAVDSPALMISISVAAAGMRTTHSLGCAGRRHSPPANPYGDGALDERAGNEANELAIHYSPNNARPTATRGALLP